MTALELALYHALRMTPAGTAFEEFLTVGDLCGVMELENCAAHIATSHREDAPLWINDLALQPNVYASACERVADVLEDFADLAR